MHNEYLKLWLSEQSKEDLIFKDFLRFEDQYLLEFKNTRKSLQINLSSRDSFIFFSEESHQFLFHRSNEVKLFFQHLNHSKLKRILLIDGERIFHLVFEKFNIYNVIEEFTLIIELIPHYNNIILCKKRNDTLIILESLKKISYSENHQRQILPGIEYKQPETSFKSTEIKVKFPLGIENMRIVEECGDSESYTSINKIFNDLYYIHYQEHKNNDLKKQISNRLLAQKIKKEKKKIKLDHELVSEEDALVFKIKAEILQANAYQIETGSSEVILSNFYEADHSPIEIQIDPKLTLRSNIEQYYKKYRKAQSGRIKVKEQIEKTEKEIEYLTLEILKVQSITSYEQLKEIFKNDCVVQKEEKKTLFRRLPINDSWEILIGRSSKENDLLTCKLSQGHDWWFHTRIFQGTHVVLRNYKKQNVPDQILLLCARLAAYYSRAKTSINVPVDYTQIRYVRKPKGSASGFVVYTQQKTIFVNPISIRDAHELIIKENINA